MYLHVRVRLHDATDWIEGRFADGFLFSNGKILQYLSFGERADALQWAEMDRSNGYESVSAEFLTHRGNSSTRRNAIGVSNERSMPSCRLD